MELDMPRIKISIRLVSCVFPVLPEENRNYAIEKRAGYYDEANVY